MIVHLYPRRFSLAAATLTGVCLFLTPVFAADPVAVPSHSTNAEFSAETVRRAWAGLPDILKRIVPPAFPDREFNVVTYGAVAGGSNQCTKSFADAIAACNHAGGGRVTVPAGKFLTGPIHLQSGVNLHLESGAEIIFSDHFEDYLPVVLVRVGGVELYNYSPLIYARNCRDVAITGPGKLNGNGQAWWAWKGRETNGFFNLGERGVPVEQRVFGQPGHRIRPNFLCLYNCTNVLLADFTIGSGPAWTIHPVYCRNTTIRGVTVDTEGPNNDGLDPDSCRDMLIEDCRFNTGDDCVVLKSGYNEDGWRVGRPTENVVMRQCICHRGHGGIVIGSEMSGDVRNVFVYDCEFDGTDHAIRIKSKRGRGGVVENIFARDLKVKNMQRDVAILNMDYGSDRNQAGSQRPPVFRNMNFENITAEGAPMAISMQGLEDSPVTNVRFVNCDIVSTKGSVLNEVQGLVFDRVQVRPAAGAVFDLNAARDISIRGSRAAQGTDVFMKVGGASSGGIRIETSDLTGAGQEVVLGEGVHAEAVKLQ